MKYKKKLTFYINEEQNISELVQYQELARERRKDYEYLERFRALPVSATFTSDAWSREKDINMHYACKVASAAEFSRIEEFISGETKMFQCRLESLKSLDILDFFAEEFLPRLKESIYFDTSDKTMVVKIDEDKINWFDPDTYRKENAQKALSVIAKEGKIRVSAHFTQFHSIFNRVVDGKIIAEISGIKSILIRTFRDVLEESVLQLYRMGVASKYIIKSSIKTSTENVQLEERYLPGCMKNLLCNLKKNKHLKHLDRKNIMNFLKNIGVPINDALAFFKRHFARADDKFIREYTYATRHAYGLEGSKIDYKSHTCMRIIRETGSAGCTGCPFSSSADPRVECQKYLLKNTTEPPPLHISPVEYYKFALSHHKSK